MRKIMNDDNVTLETKVIKPKRQISDAQREHLNKIRELAMKKKAELKEITLKSKLAKTVPKQELAKQYDEYIENKVKTQTKKEVKKEVKEEEEEEVVIVKPKKKITKKIVYKSESEEEEEEVIVKKKTKPKIPLENLVYNSNRDQLYNRMIEERVKSSIIGYGNALGV
jgi:arginine deiminase